jgi:hypothetical protein
MQRLGELFAKLYLAVQLDTTTIGQFQIESFLFFKILGLFFQVTKNWQVQCRKLVVHLME